MGNGQVTRQKVRRVVFLLCPLLHPQRCILTNVTPGHQSGHNVMGEAAVPRTFPIHEGIMKIRVFMYQKRPLGDSEESDWVRVKTRFIVVRLRLDL